MGNIDVTRYRVRVCNNVDVWYRGCIVLWCPEGPGTGDFPVVGGGETMVVSIAIIGLYVAWVMFELVADVLDRT